MVLAAGCAATVGLVASASSLSYVYRKFERLPRIELSGVLDSDTASDQPENYLLVGVDNASGLDEDDPVRNGRGNTQLSDTIMVLRIDPASQQAALLSLPRDLWIPIPESNSSQRINSMIERGGPELLIQAIAEYFGIDVNHYVQVDFASFQGLVEAIDGVPVYLPHPARDRNTGLYEPAAGCVTLDPAQSLAYVRSRHYEQLIGGDWETDPSSDLGRIDRQQDFIQRALTRAIDKGARNPATLDDLIDVGLQGISVDDDLTADDIFRLGNKFSSFEPTDLITYSVPVVGDRVGAAQILRMVDDEAEPILQVFRGTGPAGSSATDGSATDRSATDGSGSAGTGATTPTSGDDSTTAGGGSAGATGAKVLTPGEVTVRVLNGFGTSGEGSAASSALQGAGFGVAGVGEADSFDTATTEVRYPAGSEDQAATVAAWLSADATLVEATDVDAVTVVTGDDWAGVREAPRAAASSSTTGGGESGDDDSAAADDDETTTTSEGTSLTTAPPTTTAGDSATSSTSSTLDLSSHPC
jgi:LCP family protein required for cell wall assembly